MILRVRIARSAIEWLGDVGLGILLGVTLALVGLAWALAPHAADMSPQLAKLLKHL